MSTGTLSVEVRTAMLCVHYPNPNPCLVPKHIDRVEQAQYTC